MYSFPSSAWKIPLNTVLFFKIHDVSDQNGLHISNQILYFTLILKNPLMIKRSFFSPSHCVLVAGFPNSPKLHNYMLLENSHLSRNTQLLFQSQNLRVEN